MTRLGYSPEEVSLIADVLLYAQLRDSSQGIAKLAGQGMPKHIDARAVRVVKDTKVSALLDGGRNQGMVVLAEAVDIALAKAGQTGFGVAGTFNTDTSTGAIGYYARRIADAGFIGFVFSGSPSSVAPYGSFEPVFGTNPLAIGIPSDSHPVVFDMATSAVPWYALVEARIGGRALPRHVAYDDVGNATTDPERAMQGAVKPFESGPKGSGLSMIVEILTGPLVGATFAGIGDGDGNWGNLVAVLDPGLLAPADDFRTGVVALVERVKSAKRLPGVHEILVPGERGDRLAAQRLSDNEIDIDKALLAELERAAVSGREA